MSKKLQNLDNEQNISKVPSFSQDNYVSIEIDERFVAPKDLEMFRNIRQAKRRSSQSYRAG